MDINKARRLVELEKNGRKILVTLWEGNKISTCTTSEETKQACESCQGDDELCNSYIDYLKEKGYQATEIELGDLVTESLPRFIEERPIIIHPKAVIMSEDSQDAVTPANQALS